MRSMDTTDAIHIISQHVILNHATTSTAVELNRRWKQLINGYATENKISFKLY